MIEIQETENGCVFPVRVTPKAKRKSLGGAHNGALKVAVTEAPEDGKANAAVIKAIAKWLKTGKSNVEISSGHTSRMKSIFVHAIDRETLLNAFQLTTDN